jgi:hypothetical protein
VTELGPDEELTPQRRRRLGLEFALALLVIAALAAYANHARGGNHPKPTPSPTRSVSPTLPSAHAYGTGTGLLAEQPVDLPARTSDDPTACPWPDACVQSRAVPAFVASAVRAQFPTAQGLVCSTVRLVTGPIWYRQVDADVAGAELAITIERFDPNAFPVAGATTRSGPYRISARFDWPGGAPGVVGRLIADPRLLAD